MYPQFGYLQPVGSFESAEFTAAGIFGHAAPDPLVMSAGGEGNYLEIGGAHYGVAPQMGHVQTVDVGGGPANPIEHRPDARNLLRPMSSEGFWILLLGLAVVGLFSGSGNLRLGPVQLSGGVGK